MMIVLIEQFFAKETIGVKDGGGGATPYGKSHEKFLFSFLGYLLDSMFW